MKVQRRKQRDEIEFERAKLTDEMRKAIEIRDENKCRYCKRPGNTIDHLTPVSKGGKTTLGNCVLACGRCNAEKGDMAFEEYEQYLERKRKNQLTEKEKERLKHLPKECAKCKIVKQLHHFQTAFPVCSECMERWRKEQFSQAGEKAAAKF